MTEDDFNRIQRVLADDLIAIESAQYHREAFGSWVVRVAITPRLRIVWDGRESVLSVQRETAKLFNEQHLWQDIWIARDPAQQTPENAAKVIRANGAA